MRRRSVISPVPSRLGWRHCIATVSVVAGASSNVSSTVITRSDAGAAASSALSIVVLPLWVAPETRTFASRTDRPAQERRRHRCDASELNEPVEGLRMRRLNLRTLTDQCRLVTSGIATCRRDPSGRDASTNGELQVDPATGGLEHPLDEIPHVRLARAGSASAQGLRFAPMKTSWGELIQSSSMVSSSRSGCSAP